MKSKASATPAIAVLVEAGVSFQVHRFRHDPGVTQFGAEAQKSLGVSADRILKTLVVDVGDTYAFAMVPVSASLSLKAVASALGRTKAQMAARADATRVTGYVLGGVSPLGQKRRLAAVLDTSVVDVPTVLCSAGKRGLEIELSPADLARLTGAVLAPIAAE